MVQIMIHVILYIIIIRVYTISSNLKIKNITCGVRCARWTFLIKNVIVREQNPRFLWFSQRICTT